MTSPALTDYLDRFEAFSFYDPGRVLDTAIKQLPPQLRNETEGWVAYGLAAMRQAWGSLPPDVRNAVMDGLNQILDRVVSGTLDAAAGLVKGIGEDLGNVLKAIPILAAVVEFLELLIKTITQSAQKFKELNIANAIVDQKHAQLRQFQAALTNPDALVMSVMPVNNYPRFYSPSNRVNRVRFRYEPCMTPCLGPDAKMWDQGVLAPSGYGGHDCRPGMPIQNPVDHPEITPTAGVDWDPCESFIAVSALFFPYWAPNHPARVLNVYEDPYPDWASFRETPANPNSILIAGQQALLTDFRTNFQARGTRLENIFGRFTTWFGLRLDGSGVIPVGTNGLLDLPGGGGIPPSFKVDKQYREEHEHTQEVRFYRRSDGLIESYGNRGDLSAFGYKAAENLYSANLACTLAQYNTVVSQVKAFFTARRRFLENRDAMKVLVAENAGDLSRYDPGIRAAIMEQAEGSGGEMFNVQAPDFKKKRQPLTRLTRVGEIVMNVASEAMTTE